MYWPRLPNQKFKHDVYPILQKPGRNYKPDVYVVTKIVEQIEEIYKYPDIAVTRALSLCFGGNDCLLKFYGMSHTAILQDETVTTSLYAIQRNDATKTMTSIGVNQEVYLDMVKKLFAPSGTNPDKLTIKEVRQASIKYPKKTIKNP